MCRWASKNTHNTKSIKKLKARFSRLLRHPAWKWSGTILMRVKFRTLTQLFIYILSRLRLCVNAANVMQCVVHIAIRHATLVIQSTASLSVAGRFAPHSPLEIHTRRAVWGTLDIQANITIQMDHQKKHAAVAESGTGLQKQISANLIYNRLAMVQYRYQDRFKLYCARGTYPGVQADWNCESRANLQVAFPGRGADLSRLEVT